MSSTPVKLALVSALVLLFFFACTAQDATRPAVPAEAVSAPTRDQGGPIIPLPPVPPLPPPWSFLECGYTNQKMPRATPEGALLGVDVIALALVPQAVPEHVRFTITESVTRVEAQVETEPAYNTFQRPVELAMSFSRCGADFHVPPNRQLAIWRYRPATGWENLGGSVDEFNQLIRVPITQISRFGIGIN